MICENTVLQFSIFNRRGKTLNYIHNEDCQTLKPGYIILQEDFPSLIEKVK